MPLALGLKQLTGASQLWGISVWCGALLLLFVIVGLVEAMHVPVKPGNRKHFAENIWELCKGKTKSICIRPSAFTTFSSDTAILYPLNGNGSTMVY